MAKSRFAFLADRGVLSVSGADARAFLQGIVTNDVDRVTPETAIYAALLTPQGKYLFDFFIAAHGDGLLLDAEAARLPDLAKRLMMYRLRAKAEIADVSADYRVAAIFGGNAADDLGLPAETGAARAFGDGVVFVEPRLAAAGARAILPGASAETALTAAGLTAAAADDYDISRLRFALPDGSRDLVVDKATMVESNFEDLNGVDFGKGCYVGQEVTARTKYRGLVRKRLLRVDVDGPLPAPGTAITLDGKAAGTMQSGRDSVGIALLRLEHVDQAAASGEPLTAGEARLTPVKPDWATF